VIWPAFTAPLLVAALAGPAPPTEAPEQLRRSDIPLALVLSGGVSLGSYEAGLSWAVVRFSLGARSQGMPAGLGAPRLVAVTGASAGSVNALLSAVAWCSESSADESVDRNLMHDMWMGVGFDGLLPDDASGYDPDDALLSSAPLLRALDGFERWLAAARGRFRPGCRLPVGMTITRARAADEELGGLALRTQRFALPLRFEVSADGAARVVSQRLEGSELRTDALEAPQVATAVQAPLGLSWAQVEQGILASAAFPVAFRSREVCDCSARCPAANRVTSGSCEGPRGPITALSCPARSAEGEALSLCSHRYVDGGIFDNTPVGLGVELTEAVFRPQPLQPVTYLFIDPDLRRLRPAPVDAPPSEGQARPAPVRENLEAAARLLGELVATSRTQDLSRTLRDGAWNVTARGLLYDTARSLLSFAAVERQAAAALGLTAPQEEMLPRAIPSQAVRAATGRSLLRCFGSRTGQAEAARRCATELLDAASGRVAAAASPLGDEEVVAIAEAMGRAVTEVLQEVHTHPRREPRLFADEMIIGAVGMAFLADEIPRVVAGALPEPRLVGFRAALLETIQLGRALSAAVARLANALLADELQALSSDPSVGQSASRARAALLAAPDVLFVPQDLARFIEELDRAQPGGGRGRLIREMVRFGPVLQAEIVRLNRLAHAADGLQHARSERALRLSSRFAPITGSQLGNFGAFLDRPFREYDYYAGVYDAAHAIAVAMCEASAPDGGPPPLRKPTSGSELDLAAPDTQRCIGRALDAVRGGLDLERSAAAARVFRMLATAELDASIGEPTATALEREPCWSWLATQARALPDDPVVMVAEVLLSSRVACSSESHSRCIEDLTFEELVLRLKARGYQPSDASMRGLLDDRDDWVRRTARKLVDRSLERERQAPAPTFAAQAVQLAHGVGELWLRRPDGAGAMPRLDLDPSTVPDGSVVRSLQRGRFAARLVPYRIDLDVARGGFSASWLDPALWLSPTFSVVGQITPISYEAAGRAFRSSFGLLPTAHLSGMSIGMGPKAALRWMDGRVDLGGCVRLSVVQDRFALEVGTTSFGMRAHDPYVALGVSDLNGAFFWLLHGGR
jgi:predicted acylesterase/phospholipase RssA